MRNGLRILVIAHRLKQYLVRVAGHVQSHLKLDRIHNQLDLGLESEVWRIIE